MKEKAEELIREGMALHERIHKDKARLAEINGALAALATFENDSSTGHIYVQNYHAKVQTKTTIKWDQAKLSRARSTLGDERFFDLFTWEFKPKSKRTIDGFIQFSSPNEAKLIEEAMHETIAAPYVTYEYLGDL